MPSTHDQLTTALGFPPPPAYARLFDLATRLAPSNPPDAFRPLGLTNLAPDAVGRHAWCAYTPPEFVVLAWTGAASGQIGFVLDGVDADANPPVAEHTEIDADPVEYAGADLPHYLATLCARPAPLRTPFGVLPSPSPSPAWRRLRDALVAELAIDVPPTADAGRAAARRAALARGPVPTEDGLGLIVPECLVDRQFLATVRWSTPPHDPFEKIHRLNPGERVVAEAERRLARGDVGTALALARNISFNAWARAHRAQGDRAASLDQIRRAGTIMAAGYTALGRPVVAENARARAAAMADFLNRQES
jgi:hypothetical protein